MARTTLGKRTRSSTIIHNNDLDLDLPSKRVKRQTRSSQVNDENQDPKAVAIEDDNQQETTTSEITEESFSKTLSLEDDAKPSPRGKKLVGKDSLLPL